MKILPVELYLIAITTIVMSPLNGPHLNIIDFMENLFELF